MKPIITTLLFLPFIAITSCSQNGTATKQTTYNDSLAATKTIIAYYTQQNEADKKEFGEDYNTDFTIDSSNGYVSIRFADTDINEHSDYDVSYYAEMLKDDIDGDGDEDLIVPVHHSTGRMGFDWDIYFTLLRNGDSLTFNPAHILSPDNAPESICNFSFQKLDKGILYGKSMCMTDKDPRCCPTDSTKIEMKFSNDKGYTLYKQYK